MVMWHMRAGPLCPSPCRCVRALPIVRADGGGRAASPEGGAPSSWVRYPTITQPQSHSTMNHLMTSERPVCVLPSSLTSKIVSRFPQGRPRVQAAAPDVGWRT